MALIIKNSTGSDIFIDASGQNVPASSQITVDPKLYSTYSGAVASGQPSEDSTFITNINSGDLVINNSIRDLNAAEGLRFLEDFQITTVKVNNTIIANNVRCIDVVGQDVTATLNGDEVVITISGETSNIGRIFNLIFGEDGGASNEYLDNIADGKSTNQSPHVIPFNSEVIAYTYTNNNDDSDCDIEIYSVSEGNGNSPITLKDTWVLRNARTARKSNFPTAVSFSAGDKVTVYIDDEGQNPSDVTFTMYLKIVANTSSEFIEQWSGNIEPV